MDSIVKAGTACIVRGLAWWVVVLLLPEQIISVLNNREDSVLPLPGILQQPVEVAADIIPYPSSQHDRRTAAAALPVTGHRRDWSGGSETASVPIP